MLDIFAAEMEQGGSILEERKSTSHYVVITSLFESALKYLNKNFDYLALCCSSSREHNTWYLINEYWLNEQRILRRIIANREYPLCVKRFLYLNIIFSVIMQCKNYFSIHFTKEEIKSSAYKIWAQAV